MRKIAILASLPLIILAGCRGSVYNRLNKQAESEYLQPVRPASEGRNPCWNKFAKKFMYAPAFEVPSVPGADKYRFTVKGADGSWSFFSDRSDADLSPIWNQIPPSNVDLVVEALTGDTADTVYTRSFLRDFPFDGPYNGPVRSYKEAAIRAALYNHLMPQIQNWRSNTVPDMSLWTNTYPCKIIGATIRNECLVARLLPERKENALEVARSAAAFLIAQSRPEGDPLAFFPPTYYLDTQASGEEQNQGKTMTMEATYAGNAFLDLYDVTGEKEWLERAVEIGRTYVRLQREDGSLPVKVDFASGEPVNEAKALLHPLLRYFQRLEEYSSGEFSQAMAKAERWMDEEAMERFEMSGQFEDVNVLGLEPYQNLTNCTAAPYASYLLDKKTISESDISNAIDLIRFSEDQFVHWDYADTTADGFHKFNAPCVHEQYKYEMPVDNSSCNVANAWLDLYEVTGDLLALAKAKALIDNITIQQNAQNGKIPTMFNWRSPDYNEGYWMNCSYTSITTLLRLESMTEDLKRLGD